MEKNKETENENRKRKREREKSEEYEPVSTKCKSESDSSVLGPDLEPRQEKQEKKLTNQSERREGRKIQRGAKKP